MERYVALLRGVNVGGNNTVSMKALKAAFEGAGFLEVSTYINSGNVLFTCPSGYDVPLGPVCEKLVSEVSGLSIPVAVVSGAALNEALRGAPAWWGEDAASKHNAMFAIPPMEAAALAEQVGPYDPAVERVAVCGPVIFWSAPIRDMTRARWFKAIGTPVYASVTIRNANTARRLGALAGE